MLRIAFLGQSGPYSPTALRILLEAQARPDAKFMLVAVLEGRKKPVNGIVHRYRKPRPRPAPVTEELAEIATAYDIGALQTCDVNAPAVVKWLEEQVLDVIVCVGFDRLFSPAILQTASWGGINAHPSPLPKLRGPSPIFWLLHAGANKSALTLHALDAREDHGAIFAQQPFVLPPRATGEDIYSIAGALAGRMLVPLLNQLASGELPRVSQNESAATRAPRPTAEDAMIEPGKWQCEALVNFACGAPFFRTPWLKLGDDIFFVRRGVSATPGMRMPAEYVLQGGLLHVQCADGVAQLEIQR